MDILEIMESIGFKVTPGMYGEYRAESDDIVCIIAIDDSGWHLWADNRRCFDKRGNCPLRISSITLEKEIEGEFDLFPTLLSMSLNFLSSPEGYEISNTFSYLDENPFTLSYQLSIRSKQ